MDGLPYLSLFIARECTPVGTRALEWTPGGGKKKEKI